MSFWKSFGPGVLFAGAAIGTSHLVQSTRAGAMFGLGFLLIVVATNIIKYPAYRFGPQYAAATGKSLIEGYFQIGRWVVSLYVVIEVAVISIIIAATAIVTAAILVAVGGLSMDPRLVASLLLVVAAILLFVGGYKLLDRLTKVFVSILTIATVAATILSLPQIQWAWAALAPPEFDFATFSFAIALMGFMPAGMDLSVLQSLWSVSQSKVTGSPTPLRYAIADFNVGYIGSAILAICFLLMGAGVMHSANVAPETGAAGFAALVIALYTTNLGAWAGTLVGVSAFFVMFTTLITILDGMPRLVATGIVVVLRDGKPNSKGLDRSPLLFAVTGVLVVAAVLILLFLMSGFQRFIDFVTITAFIVAPFTAALNHVVMNSAEIPDEFRPSSSLRIWSLFGLVFLTLLAMAYLYARVVV